MLGSERERQSACGFSGLEEKTKEVEAGDNYTRGEQVGLGSDEL